MAKQTIGIGTVVDDGTGDYLKKGGEKINENFTEIYDNLGDGNVPFPAGAWKKFPEPGAIEVHTLNVDFGQSFVIDTSTTDVDVYLPKGSSADFGKVIKLRDVFGTWGVNRIRLIPATGDTVLGYATPRYVQRKFSDLELIFAMPGSWEYLENKLINKLSSADISTVHKREIRATEGQTDFPNILGGDFKYNPNQLEIFRKGNLLYYGNEFSDSSDYGSISGDTIGKLDGISIKLRVPCDNDDIITIITYLDDIATYRSSYTTATVTAYDINLHPDKVSIPGKQYVGDLSKKKTWVFDDFGLTQTDGTFNPFTTEVLINGTNLTMGGKGDLPGFVCVEYSPTPGPGEPEPDNYLNDIIPNADTLEECGAKGGDWVYSGLDYTVIPNSDDDPSTQTIFIRRVLEDGDILTVRWYNNDIGTVMELDEIIEESDKRYLKSVDTYNVTKAIRYNTISNPTPRDVEPETSDMLIGRIDSLPLLLDIIYPIGSLYMNAHNQSNPFEYMSFGRWVPYAQGKAIVGWEDGDDANFSFYTDEQGSIKSPGGTGGNLSHTIQKDEIPTLTSSDDVLIKDPNGTIIIGECQMDPSDDPDGPAYHKYREDTLKVNEVPNPNAIPMLQPFITVSVWLRIA